jgi:hypothetical protein
MRRQTMLDGERPSMWTGGATLTTLSTALTGTDIGLRDPLPAYRRRLDALGVNSPARRHFVTATRGREGGWTVP